MSSGNTNISNEVKRNESEGDSAGRVSQFSYIRTAAAFAIVLLHCFNSSRVYLVDTLSETETTTAYAACSALMWAVPCFLMVTGALLLDRDRVIPASKLFGKYIRRMITALVVFTAIFTVIKHYGSPGPVIIEKFFDGLLYNHCMAYLWYLYLMLALYLLMPVFKAAVNRLSDVQLSCLAAVLLVVCSVLPFASYMGIEGVPYIPTQIVYGVYLLLGFLLFRHRMNAVAAALLFAACTMALPVMTFRLTAAGIDATEFTGYNSLIVVLQSAAAFSLMMSIRRPAEGIIDDIDRCSFGIYLIHMLFIRLTINRLGFDPFALGTASFIALAMVFFLLSYVVTYELKKLRIFDFL